MNDLLFIKIEWIPISREEYKLFGVIKLGNTDKKLYCINNIKV